MSNYQYLFYWMTVADNARAFFIVCVFIFTLIAVIATICNFIFAADGWDSSNTKDDNLKGQAIARSWIRYSVPFAVLFWSLLIFTPSKRDALLIVAGGGVLNYLSSDSTAKTIPKELLTFAKTEIENLGESAKVDLDIKSQKDKILDQAKSMTTDQLLDKMKVDSNFAKVVLNK